MKNTRKKLPFPKDEEGLAAIEFGLIAPVMFLMFFGLVDLTGLISTSRKVTNASAVIADLVAQNTAPFPSSILTDYTVAAQMLLPDREPSEIRVEIFAYQPNAARTAAIRKWSMNSGTGPACQGTINVNNMPALMQAPNDLIVARVCVDYEPGFGTWRNSPVLGALTYNVRETTITRPRTRSTIDCTNCPP
jgi:Flp pilus assembly protein TadG